MGFGRAAEPAGVRPLVTSPPAHPELLRAWQITANLGATDWKAWAAEALKAPLSREGWAPCHARQ